MSTENERIPRESVEGVDAVLNRMYELTGAVGMSWATALDVSPDTIKTWRRRGAVPMRFLTEFAAQHGVGVDVLRFGAAPYPLAAGAPEHLVAEPGAGVLLSPRELALVRHYREASKTGQAALDLVAAELAGGLAPGAPEPGALHQVNVSAAGGNAAGRDMVVTQNKGGRKR